MAQLVKVRRPSVAPPVGGLGRIGAMGGDTMQAIDRGIEEFVPVIKFGTVALGWVMGDLVLHQLFHTTAGHATPPGYYGSKLLWSIPVLIAGRVASDLIGGTPFVRALTIATVATSLIQIQYLQTATVDFNFAVFFIHLSVLTPLCLLIAGEPGKELLPFMRKGAGAAARGY